MVQRALIAVIFVMLGIGLSGCATGRAAVTGDLLGLSIGMEKSSAEARLREIAVFEKDLRKRQQMWRLKDDPSFSKLGVGYTDEGRIRFITAFVDKENPKQRIKFTEVGDLSTAKSEITGPHYRYIWDRPASDGSPGYQVIVYGDQKDFVLYYTLVDSGSLAEEEDE
ncbi:MAG TPA: hypothetical protein VGO43_04805 [Pyrinomonadaceae bacterium]|nr:hypothetical protein [Pyrinomonadaceae bacterium]